MLHAHATARLERHAGDVEAEPLERRILRELLTPQTLGGGADARLLAGIDAVERALIGRRATRPHLDHDGDGPVARDEIELEPPHADVGAQDLEASRSEVVGYRQLRAPPKQSARARRPKGLPRRARVGAGARRVAVAQRLWRPLQTLLSKCPATTPQAVSVV